MSHTRYTCFKINSENAEDEVREAFKVFDGVRYKTCNKSPKVSNIQSIQPTLCSPVRYGPF